MTLPLAGRGRPRLIVRGSLRVAVAFALLGTGTVARSASCLGALPANGALPGWTVLDKSTRSGSMGSQASFSAYDGAVESMQAKGMVAFAQRVLRHGATRRLIQVDVYYMKSASQASAHFQAKRTGYKRAKPLRVTVAPSYSVGVGALGQVTVGFGVRGKFVWEISMSRATAEQDRKTVGFLCSQIAAKLAR